MTTFSSLHIPFPAGCPMMIAGPTGCGKTCLVYKILKNKYNFSLPVARVLYCYGVFQKMYKDMGKHVSNIEFHKDLPKLEKIKEFAEDNTFKVVVLDDLMEKVLDNLDAQQLFTKFCHHYNFTTIFLTQNVFAPGKCARNISLNTLLLILFQNYRDRSQIWTVARQISPQSPSLFIDVFEKATKKPFGYLVVDCTPHCPDEYRWRTDIFKDENNQGTCFVKPSTLSRQRRQRRITQQSLAHHSKKKKKKKTKKKYKNL